MPDALTSTQLEILRRARDGLDLYSAPYLTQAPAELYFLIEMRLLQRRNVLDLQLTQLGADYLGAAELEIRARLRETRLPPPQA